MTTRLPIPVLALLGLQLSGCGGDEPIVGAWDLVELNGEPKTDEHDITLELAADLSGVLVDTTELYGEEYSYTRTLAVDASAAPTYVIDVLPGEDLPAGRLRCELADDTLTCADMAASDYGDPVFKRR